MTEPLLPEADSNLYQPLAARMRPRCLEEFVGQEHILGPQQALYQAIKNKRLHSMLFWGPPGVGKTTLARLIATASESRFESLSAVLAGIKDIREAIDRAHHHRIGNGQQTLLFVDEVHRFNKSQQDAFLPHIENGTILFIGATTENPAFELNNALLSRARIYVLKSLSEDQLARLVDQALADNERGVGNLNLEIDKDARQLLAQVADGDGRRVLNFLEIASDMVTPDAKGVRHIDLNIIAMVTQERMRRFDKGGDLFYEQISALHKAVRGSAPDAALYWFVRMLDAGCDPLYIARRLLRMATEDIGNADPRALQLALAGWDTYTRLGSPEGELALGQVLVYLACAPKSNAVYNAVNAVTTKVRQTGSLDVPLHLRNASTRLATEMGYGEEYRYAHNESDTYAAGESYFPEELKDLQFYYPVNAGLEAKIREKLEYLKGLDKSSANKRYQDK